MANTEYVYSDDEGKTWSSPKELVKGDIGGRGPVKISLYICQITRLFLRLLLLAGDSWELVLQTFR